MAFRLDPRAAPGPELRRLFEEQTHEAIAGFSGDDPHRAVHEARKACKRTRALVALVRRSLDREQAEGLRKAYRDAARHVGPLRDAFVMQRTLERLLPELDAEAVLGPAVMPGDGPERRAACVAGLEGALRRLQRVDWSGVDRHSLLFGMRRSYAAVRQQRAPAVKSGEIEPFHEWRKAVKAWGYHLQLFVDIWPPVMQPIIEQADTLQEILGDHHDLGVLRESLPAGLDSRTADRIRGVARAREDLLYAEARDLSRPLVAMSPRTFEDLIRDLWHAARRTRG